MTRSDSGLFTLIFVLFYTTLIEKLIGNPRSITYTLRT